MAAVNMKDGLVKLLTKDYLTHGISVVVEEDNQITIDFHVIIAYGVSIATVSDDYVVTGVSAGQVKAKAQISMLGVNEEIGFIQINVK